MNLAVKGTIRIANEESNCLSLFVILTMPLITMLMKKPQSWNADLLSQLKHGRIFFWPKSETFSEKKL